MFVKNILDLAKNTVFSLLSNKISVKIYCSSKSRISAQNRIRPSTRLQLYQFFFKVAPRPIFCTLSDISTHSINWIPFLWCSVYGTNRHYSSFGMMNGLLSICRLCNVMWCLIHIELTNSLAGTKYAAKSPLLRNVILIWESNMNQTSHNICYTVFNALSVYEG